MWLILTETQPIFPWTLDPADLLRDGAASWCDCQGPGGDWGGNKPLVVENGDHDGCLVRLRKLDLLKGVAGKGDRSR